MLLQNNRIRKEKICNKFLIEADKYKYGKLIEEMKNDVLKIQTVSENFNNMSYSAVSYPPLCNLPLLDVYTAASTPLLSHKCTPS